MSDPTIPPMTPSEEVREQTLRDLGERRTADENIELQDYMIHKWEIRVHLRTLAEAAKALLRPVISLVPKVRWKR